MKIRKFHFHWENWEKKKTNHHCFTDICGRSDPWTFVVSEKCYDILWIFHLVWLCSLEPPLAYFCPYEKLLHIPEESQVLEGIPSR